MEKAGPAACSISIAVTGRSRIACIGSATWRSMKTAAASAKPLGPAGWLRGATRPSACCAHGRAASMATAHRSCLRQQAGPLRLIGLAMALSQSRALRQEARSPRLSDQITSPLLPCVDRPLARLAPLKTLPEDVSLRPASPHRPLLSQVASTSMEPWMPSLMRLTNYGYDDIV